MSIALFFLKEVFQSWLAIAGAIFTVLPFFQPWVERKFKRPIHLKYLWMIGGVCLVLSFYEAWLEQYNEVQVVRDENAQYLAQKAALDGTAKERNERIEDLRQENAELRARTPQVNVQVPPSQVQIVRVPDVACSTMGCAVGLLIRSRKSDDVAILEAVLRAIEEASC